MNIILLKPSDDWLKEDVVRLAGRRADHIRQQLQAVPGQTVRVGLLGGPQGQAEITGLDADAVELLVVLDQPPPSRHRFDVVLALPRPKMLRRIFRTVAEFGVAHLHLINSARVEKSYWQTPLLQSTHVADALQAGMERARDTIAPQVHCHQRFRPFVEDELTSLCAGRPCWITDQGAPLALADVPDGDAVVMVGPEGGFVPFEIDLACQTIANRVHLGGRTLSVDTALTSSLAVGVSAVSAACGMPS